MIIVINLTKIVLYMTIILSFNKICGTSNPEEHNSCINQANVWKYCSPNILYSDIWQRISSEKHIDT